MAIGHESLRRYGGYPDLLMKEHRRRNLSLVFRDLHGDLQIDPLTIELPIVTTNKRGPGATSTVRKGVRHGALASSACTRREVNELRIEPLKNLSPEECKVQARSIRQLLGNPEAYLDRYVEIFGNEIGSDNAAELFPDYSASREARRANRIAVARSAAWVSHEVFRRRILERDAQVVLFTAGGTGSGKSTFAANLCKADCIVFDSTFSDTAGHGALVEEALKAQCKVMIVYIFRDPLAAYTATLKRAAEEACGRTITPRTHARTHEGAARTVKYLSGRYADNPKVAFRFIDNADWNPCVGSIELTSRGDYTDLTAKIQALDVKLHNLT